jgi:hypothetical protein
LVEYFRLARSHFVDVTKQSSKGNLSLSVEGLFVILKCGPKTETDVTLIVLLRDAN